MTHDGDGSPNGSYGFSLELRGCIHEVLASTDLLREFLSGLWQSTVGTPVPNTVVNRLARPEVGYTVTQMGAGCTLTGRFDTALDAASIRFSSAKVVDVEGAEKFVRDALRPDVVTTGTEVQ